MLTSCEDKGSGVLKKAAERSVLGQVVMQWAIAFAAATNFKSASSQLKQLVQRIFGTWLQSRINEQANKVLRDSERSKRANKAVLACTYDSQVVRETCGDKPAALTKQVGGLCRLYSHLTVHATLKH